MAMRCCNYIYCFEQIRLESFIGWRGPNLDPGKLAAAGFIYLGTGDLTKCFSCQRIIGNWRPNDDPKFVHLKCGSDCKFIKGFPSGNIPLQDPPFRLPRVTAGQAPVPFIETGANQGPITITPLMSPTYPLYENFMSRVHSFATWPEAIPIRAAEMAKAGFFYTRVNDTVKCFYCNLTMSNWQSHDVPSQQHAFRQINCRYLQSSMDAQAEAERFWTTPLLMNPTSSRTISSPSDPLLRNGLIREFLETPIPIAPKKRSKVKPSKSS